MQDNNTIPFEASMLEGALYIKTVGPNKSRIVNEKAEEGIDLDIGITKLWEVCKEDDEFCKVSRALIVKRRAIVHINPNKGVLTLAPNSTKAKHIQIQKQEPALKLSADSLRKIMTEIVAAHKQEAKDGKFLLANRNECYYFTLSEILYVKGWSDVRQQEKKTVQGETDNPDTTICFMNGEKYKMPFTMQNVDGIVNGLMTGRGYRERCSRYYLVNVDRIIDADMKYEKLLLEDGYGYEVELDMPKQALLNYRKKKDPNTGGHFPFELKTVTSSSYRIMRVLPDSVSRYDRPRDQYAISVFED